MRVAVTGAAGLLGRHVRSALARRGVDFVAVDRPVADVTDRAALERTTRGVTVIIHAAAFTNVDGAERDELGAYRANVLGAENAALAANAHGARLTYASTDFIFDGRRADGYDELVRHNFAEVRSSELAAPAARPSVCLFHHRMLELHGFGPIPDWSVVLNDYLSTGASP